MGKFRKVLHKKILLLLIGNIRLMHPGKAILFMLLFSVVGKCVFSFDAVEVTIIEMV